MDATASLNRFSIVEGRSRFTQHYSLTESGCWVWKGGDTFEIDGSKLDPRDASYLLHVGHIRERSGVVSTCDTSGCVNPVHLALVLGGPKPYAWVYSDVRWKRAREAALLRDGHRCTVSRFFGRPCNGALHVHHLVALADGGDPFGLDNLGTACARHHAQWEALRAEVIRSLSDELAHRVRVACPHEHRSREAREQCERRMARRRGLIAA